MSNNGQNLTLSDRQKKAIPAILHARSISEGVKKASITRSTFYEWMKEPEFRAEFERQRQEIIEIALNELKLSVGEAVCVLKGLLKSDQDNIRFRTATAILEHISKFMELEELEKRITEIERRLG